MNREVHVGFYEGVGVESPRAARPLNLGQFKVLPKYMEAVVMNVDEVIKKYVSEQRGTYKKKRRNSFRLFSVLRVLSHIRSQPEKKTQRNLEKR
jgi:hypothetical protein